MWGKLHPGKSHQYPYKYLFRTSWSLKALNFNFYFNFIGGCWATPFCALGLLLSLHAESMQKLLLAAWIKPRLAPGWPLARQTDYHCAIALDLTSSFNQYYIHKCLSDITKYLFNAKIAFTNTKTRTFFVCFLCTPILICFPPFDCFVFVVFILFYIYLFFCT